MMGRARPAGVLIASRQEWTTRSLETILASRGYRVVKTYTWRQALDRVRADEPDALIIDSQLDDGDGRDLCRQLRALRLITASTPIFLSQPTPPTRRDRLTALQAGAWDCLRAPLDAEELLALLDTFVAAKIDADAARTDGMVDPGTGLYNARGLTRRARELASQASRRRGALGCVLLAPLSDADQDGGELDALLVRIAAALKATARQSDAIGRLGPSAFVVLAADTDAAQARALAQRLRTAILAAAEPGAPDPLPSLRLVGGCHGVADFQSASIDTTELLMRATAALEKARSDPGGAWLRTFEDADEVRAN